MIFINFLGGVSLSFDIFELQKEILPSILKTRGIPTHNPTFYQGSDQGDNQMLYVKVQPKALKNHFMK